MEQVRGVVHHGLRGPTRSDVDPSNHRGGGSTAQSKHLLSPTCGRTKRIRHDQAVDANDQADDGDEQDEQDEQDAVMQEPVVQDDLDLDLGEVIAPSLPCDSWAVAYIYAYLLKFTDLYPCTTPNKKSLLPDIQSFEDALLSCSPPSTSCLRRNPKTGLVQSDHRPSSTIHRATWLPSEITQAEYEYDLRVAQAQVENVPPPPFPTTGPLSTEPYEIPSPPPSILLIEIMQRFYDIMGYFPEFYNPKDRKGWFAWCVRFINTRLSSGPLKGGIGWEVNLIRRVGVKIGREDEANFWRLKWEEKVHVIRHIIDYLLTYGKAIRREIKVAYENERDPKDNMYESSSDKKDDDDDDDDEEEEEEEDPNMTEPTIEDELEPINPLAFEPLGTTSTITIPQFGEKEQRGNEVLDVKGKESLMMVYALDSSARLFGLAFTLPRRRNEEDMKLDDRFNSTEHPFEWRTLTRSIDDYKTFINRVEEVETKDIEREKQGMEKSWLINAPLRPPMKMRISKTKTSTLGGMKKRKTRSTMGGDSRRTPQRTIRSTVLGKRSFNYFEVEQQEEETWTEGRRSLRSRVRRMVQQQQQDDSTDVSDDEDEPEPEPEPEPKPNPIVRKPLSQILKDRFPLVQKVQTLLDEVHTQRQEEEKFIQERLGFYDGIGRASSSKFKLESTNEIGPSSFSTTNFPLLPPRLPTPPPPPMISARSARLRVQEEKAQHDYYAQLNEQTQRQQLQHELAQREHQKKQEAKIKAQAMKVARMEEKKREEEERERIRRENERRDLEKRIRERRAEGEGGRRVSKRLSLQLGVDEERLRVLVEEDRKREEEVRRRKEEEAREKEIRAALAKEVEVKREATAPKGQVQGGEATTPIAEVPMTDGITRANGSTAPPRTEPVQPPTMNGVEAAVVGDLHMAGNVGIQTAEPSQTSAPIEQVKSVDPIVEAAPSPLLETPLAPSIEATTLPPPPETNGHASLPKSSTPPPPEMTMTDQEVTPSTTDKITTQS
ncbi:BQ2448_3804 [Microbotryum intermedium]|uniref:BQ2448_3804 protein n=1 Tax=Microbotryum intermedium TaxID=269621 RepID=A0A238FB14_9BASI|nr:BQ2448_3804 [Microbotryum intermedium]